MNYSFTQDFKENVIYRLDESTRMVRICLERLSEGDVWKKPGKNSNSVGNLILHLCGNITQYAIASLANNVDNRNRDAEFETSGGFSKEELLSKLINVVDEAKRTIREVSDEELLRVRQVQGFTMSGIGIAIHVTEHYSYHTGQIAFWTKQVKDKDLGFYDGIDLNTKND